MIVAKRVYAWWRVYIDVVSSHYGRTCCRVPTRLAKALCGQRREIAAAVCRESDATVIIFSYPTGQPLVPALANAFRVREWICFNCFNSMHDLSNICGTM